MADTKSLFLGSSDGSGVMRQDDRRTLNFGQVARLTEVVDSPLAVPGRGNYPTLNLTVRQLVVAVRRQLLKDGMGVHDVRINGGAASYIIIGDSSGDQVYNDLDIIFRLDRPPNINRHKSSSLYDLDQVKDSALLSLLDFLPSEVNRCRLKPAVLSEAYLKKMVKIDGIRSGSTSGDCWSLISLDNDVGRTVEMKFVVTMRRQYEFSIDSFQVIIDDFLRFSDIIPPPPEMSDNFYPTVVAESAYGDFEAAVVHAEQRLIATRNPEEVRGGGLLKYCALVARGYHHAKDFDAQLLEQYMCTRFFIDFPDADRQYAQLDNYLTNHFDADWRRLRIPWLSTVRLVVNRSARCLIGHRRKQIVAIVNQLIDTEQHPPSPLWSIPPPPFLPEHALPNGHADFHGSVYSDDDRMSTISDVSLPPSHSNTPSEVDQSDAASTASDISSVPPTPANAVVEMPQLPPGFSMLRGPFGYGHLIPAVQYGGFYVPCIPVFYTAQPPFLPAAFVQRS